MEQLNFQGSLPLSKQELYFKTLVQRYGNDFVILESSSPVIGDLSKIDAVFSLKNLQEARFIPEDSDAAVLRHSRYTPALLHSHDFIEVVYVLRGSCCNYINSSTLPLSRGDICIIAKGALHALGVFSDDCVTYNLMIRTSTFEKVFLGILPEHDVLSSFLLKSLYQNGSSSYLCFPTGADQRILQCFSAIYEECQQHRPYSRYMLNSLISMFFIILIRHYSALASCPNPVNHASVNKDISTILYYMQQNYDTVTLKGLASLFHYSERHLSRLLKEYTKMSYTELLQQIRLQKAAELLRSSSMPVAEIITKVGYSDFGFFYRIFKATFHMTPVEYRKRP